MLTDNQRTRCPLPYIRAIDDETCYLDIVKSLKYRRKSLILRIGSFGDTGKSVGVEVTEWDLINLLKQLDVGSDELYFERVFDEEARRELLLAAPIRAFNLSIRTSGYLKYAGIDTIDKLIEKTAQDLKQIRGFGQKSLYEIQELLDKLGFSLRSTHDV
jgi:DNA-directed RNA polymerase alpha subunit